MAALLVIDKNSRSGARKFARPCLEQTSQLANCQCDCCHFKAFSRGERMNGIEMDGEIVVLTGASGCLGHHTLKLLIGYEDKVREIRCLDIREPETSMKKIIEKEQEAYREKTGRQKIIKWIKGDIRDINIVEQTLDGADCVFHCAAKIDVWTEASEQDADELESINVGGTEQLLKAAILHGVYKFIHVSSFEVYIGYDTIYYATESTLPNNKWFLFGASASTKKEAENKVKQYSNNKLCRQVRGDKDSLNAIIVRFPTIYGEFDRHYVSKILEVTKFFGGKLRRLDNIWIRQQPIYAGNAAWSLIKAKHRMDIDHDISGEEFHITDETIIGDPFDFVEPFLNSHGMHVTKRSYPFLPLLLLIWLFFVLKRLARTVDVFKLFTNRKSRLQEAIDKDKSDKEGVSMHSRQGRSMRWHDYITPQTFSYMCNSNFLNRTKASLRLGYEPIVGPDESKLKSINWYKTIRL